jgi:outer membrane receptor protein involved in Fe transport
VNHRQVVPLLGVAAAAVTLVVFAEAQESAPSDVSAPAQAQPQDQSIEEIVVFGRAQTLLGTADAASEGTIGGADLLVRPLLRVAELLESVPGLIAAQHSGSGKANQYFLRGFNLDHGTDFTTYVDGVPLNLRSHGHGQGYLDINGLMPETVERINYRKGTYRADVGDFSMAGSSFITTIDHLDAPFMSYESGEYGWDRVAAGGSRDAGKGALTGVAEWKAYDGPWALAEHLQHIAAWGKYTRSTSFGTLAATVSAYDADWLPTEQIPERAIGTSVCADAFCALDSTARGHTSRWIGAAQVTGAAWEASAYLQYYDWKMQSDPTYDFQINQFDRRWTTGGRYERWLIDKANLTVNIGTEFRYDDIGNVGVDHDNAGVFVENVSRNRIQETSVGVFSEATWSLTDSLRVVGGLRGDAYDFNVTAKSPGSFAGSRTDAQVSPKVGVAYTLNKDVEVYGNWGRGFHSNDARGVVNSAVTIPGLSPGTGYEAGARFEIGALKLTSAYWWLDLDSELIFVGDSNSVEPRGASRRDGYELTFFWRPIDWLGIDAVYTGSKARYVDNPDGRYIEGSVEHAGELGIQAVKDRWEGSLRMRYLGPYALTPDNINRADSETTISLRGAYRVRRTMFYAELFNITNATGKDIVYWYETHVPGLDPAGTSSADVDCGATNCRVSRAQEPRTLRVGAKVSF